MCIVVTVGWGVSTSWVWREWARCRDVGASVFFAPDSEHAGARARREAAAQRICAGCPVLTECRGRALAMGEGYGIWGGMTERGRRRHLRRPCGTVVNAGVEGA
ncbi:WhiB family transcriptional regulator [Rhodococcus opacus]|uniref:Transcriptional regulator WhiB n=1 Tax=Rhodococcus opacus RKJ300 = JCM 13270 TaxID=1165867 RepID=I0WNS9_RHOOP|nr:WhiB family transcriptional regulator [Rhodococcus opacus RKJ300 = JCM 13270]QQZ19561.1 WhiB family transcriptional regulator [Rhodococcus sp. 21391]